MTVVRTSRPSRIARRLRSALMLTTALTFGGAGQAFAQSVVDTGGTSDIIVTQPTATGAATAVYLRTDGGKIDAAVTTTTATATDVAGGAVISLDTTGDKAITGNFGTITTTGNGDSVAVYANAGAGNINIQTGTIDSTGNFTAGVLANSLSGNVVLTGDALRLRGTDYDADGNTGDGLTAFSREGAATVTLGSGEVSSPIGSIAVAITGESGQTVGGNAAVTVGSGKTTGDRGTAIFALTYGIGTATATTTGTVEATGKSVSGVVVARSVNGAAVVNAGTTIASGEKLGTNPNSYAVQGISKTGTTINAGTTSAVGRAVTGTASAGDVTITTTGNTHSELENAVTISTTDNTTAAVNAVVNLAAGTTTSSNATSNISTVYLANIANDATLNSAGTVTGKSTNSATISVTAGNKAVVNSNVASNTGAGAIFANGTNGTTVTAGDTAAAGYGIQAVSALGDVMVSTTGDTSSVNGNAISVSTALVPNLNAPGGNVTISTAADTNTSSSAAAAGTIGVTARGNLTLNLAGMVTGSQTGAATIGGQALGAGTVVATVADVTNTGTREAIGLAGAGGVELNVAKAHSAASTTNVIQVGSANGNVQIHAGSVTGSASNAMINALGSAATSTVSITAENVVNANPSLGGSVFSTGIFGQAGGGVTIVAGNVEAQGQAIRALTTLGNAQGDGNISVTTTGDITSRGSNAISIGGLTKSFDVTLAEGHTVSGTVGTIVAGGTRRDTGGDATITNNGTIAALGAAESAIGATTWGNLAVKSNIVTVEGLGTPNSGFTPAGFSLVSTGGGNVSLESNSATVAGEGRHGAYLSTVGAGNVSVTSGTISNTDENLAAITASAIAGDVTIASGTTTASGDNAHAIDAWSTSGNITITSAIASAGGRAIDAYTDTGDIAITTTGNTTALNDGPAIGADGFNVSIVLGEGTVTDGFEGGIEAEARGDLMIDARGAIRGHDEDAIGIAAEVTGSGSASITSNSIEITGTGEDPGVTNGFRSGQGGIAVTAGDGAISIASNRITVAGDKRYGIYALGNGAIDVTSATLAYDSVDSAGIMILGGEGAVTVTSGTLTASGASGAGIVARTGSGDITIAADQTHLRGTGMSGNYTADAVVALSDSGAVSIASNSASTAGLYGSAVAGIGSAVTIASTTASASGDQGAVVYARALAGDATIVSGTVTSTGPATDAIAASASGKVTIASEAIVSSAAGARGIYAEGNGGAAVTTGNIATDGYAVRAISSSGDTAVTANGAVASANGHGVHVEGGNSTVTLGAAHSVSGKTVGVTGASRTLTSLVNAGTITGDVGVGFGGTATIANTGTIAGTGGAAIVSTGQTSLTNSGTLTAGTGALAVALGDQDDTVTLATGSLVSGAIDGGAGRDMLVLSGTGATRSATQSLAQSLNFEELDVASGYWTAAGPSGDYAQVAIRSGATLQLDVVDGESPVTTGNVLLDGVLVLNANGTASTGLEETAIAGSGGLTLIGSGVVVVASPNLTYTGPTTVNGGTLQLTGNLVGDVVIGTGGIFRLGNGDATGTIEGDLINNGLFVYDRSDSYTIAGDFTGSGGLTKNGEGVLTFGGAYGFTGSTTINGGSVKFTGQLAPTTEINLTSGTLDLSAIEGGEQTIGELAGSAAGGVELGSSELIVNQTSNTSFAGTISGEGGITKTGTGTLDLTGVSDYTGDTEVQGGTLKVNGSIASSNVVMASGGTLGGNGTIGGLSGTGGNVAPGNSIGQLTVAGNIVWNPAFVYQVEVNAAGGADRIDATGSAQLGGATLQVLPEAGRYRGRTNYTILTAAGGVSGTFGTITSNFAFLTPTVAYGATTVTLSLTRNNAAFASFGQNGNQVAVAGALQALGAGNALFEETLLLQDTGASPAFASLTGELHAGISSGRIENAQALRRSLLGRAAPVDAGLYGWASALGNWGNFDKSNRSSQVKTDMTGAMGGIGFSRGGLDLALGVAGTRSNFTTQGHADGTSRMIVGSLSYAAGGLWATAGGAYAWDEFDTRRASALGAIAETLTDEYEGETRQFFGELGYGAQVGPALVGPFAGLSHVEVTRDAIAEAGGGTGLNIAAGQRQLTFATAGIKARAAPLALGDKGWTVEPNVSVAYRRAWGDRAETLMAGFVGTAGTFGVLAPVIGRDAAEVGLGIGVTNGRFRLNAGYTATYQKHGSNHSAQLSLGFAF